MDVFSVAGVPMRFVNIFRVSLPIKVLLQLFYRLKETCFLHILKELPFPAVPIKTSKISLPWSTRVIRGARRLSIHHILEHPQKRSRGFSQVESFRLGQANDA